MGCWGYPELYIVLRRGPEERRPTSQSMTRFSTDTVAVQLVTVLTLGLRARTLTKAEWILSKS
jgi:hypothetical protein